MNIELLPFEIIQLISSTLKQSSNKDIYECCLVSKKWLTLFTTILYNEITIRGPQHFNRLYKSLLLGSTSLTYHKYDLIRSLTIQDGNINKLQLSQLPKLCPHLVNLTIDGRAEWDYYDFYSDNNNNNIETEEEKIWWYHLKQACILSTNITPILMKTTNIHLTHLTIRCKYDYDYGQNILNSLKYTSHLQFLTVDEYMWSIKDMNQIHESCPRLKKLLLTRATLLRTSYHYLNDHLSMIKKAYINEPATSIYELKLQDVTLEDFDLMYNDNDETQHDQALSSLSSSNWLLYIVLKYPYLEQLEWWHKSFRGQLFYPSIHPIVSNLLLQQCSQLNSICFFNINVNDDFYLSLLSRKKGPMINNLGINHSIDVLNSATSTLTSSLPLLSSFSLWWNQHENQNYVQFLPWKLTKLHLSGRICDGLYDLHFILDHCKFLEHLHIDFGEIRQQQPFKPSSYYHQTPQHCHPLKKLVMEEIKLTSNIMTTISCRCQHLIELDIIDCTWMENHQENHDIHLMNDSTSSNYQQHDHDHHQLQLNQDKMNVIHIQFYHQKLKRLHLSGIRFSNNPLLRSKSIGIYEFKHPEQMLWYYLSHHATFLTYKPTLGYRYKHPVEVTQCHSIIKKYNDKNNHLSSSSYQQQNPSICLGPPVELNALREMQRQYGRYSRFQPCSGYVIFICQSVNEVYLENKIMLK